MEHSHFVIGVAGGSGSGKTTVVSKLVEALAQESVAVIAHDNYYRDQAEKPMEERILVNYDHPDSLETELLVEHVTRLKQGKSIQQPTYDFVEYTRSTETILIAPKPIIIIEGILIFESQALREQMDLKIFVDTDADVRFIRRLTRDIAERGRTLESVVAHYIGSVKPMYEQFVEPTRKYADIIIPEGGHNTKALDLLLARIREISR